MSNTSASGGYLQPTPPPPLDGAALEDFFHDFIVGLTALPNTLVRPAFQIEPPNIPPKGTIWLAFAFEDVASDTFPFVGHHPVNDGGDELQRHEEFDVRCSVYGSGAGSDARATAKLLRDNLAIAQNREPLRAQAMGLVSCGAPLPVPVLLKQTWLYRLDIVFRIRRCVTRDYDVLNIVEADIDLEAEVSNDSVLDRTITVKE